LKSGGSGHRTWKGFATTCCGSIRAAGTSASAAECRTTSLRTTPSTASGRATSSTGRSSTATCAARRSCARTWRSGASRPRSGWSEQAPFGRHIHAEAAFSVETEYRRRGIGEKLFRRIQRAATNHGVETIEIICLPDNVGMQRLAQKFKTQFTFEENSLTGRLTARRPTAYSLMREASGDMADFGASLFDAQMRAFAASAAKSA
jgi:GNAT superfamily N-acetyltransferase